MHLIYMYMYNNTYYKTKLVTSVSSVIQTAQQLRQFVSVRAKQYLRRCFVLVKLLQIPIACISAHNSTISGPG